MRPARMCPFFFLSWRFQSQVATKKANAVVLEKKLSPNIFNRNERIRPEKVAGVQKSLAQEDKRQVVLNWFDFFDPFKKKDSVTPKSSGA